MEHRITKKIINRIYKNWSILVCYPTNGDWIGPNLPNPSPLPPPHGRLQWLWYTVPIVDTELVWSLHRKANTLMIVLYILALPSYLMWTVHFQCNSLKQFQCTSFWGGEGGGEGRRVAKKNREFIIINWSLSNEATLWNNHYSSFLLYFTNFLGKAK